MSEQDVSGQYFKESVMSKAYCPFVVLYPSWGHMQRSQWLSKSQVKYL